MAVGALAAALAMSGSTVDVIDVEDVVPALGSPQEETDLAPAGLDLTSVGDVEADSLRSIGADDAGTYWVARTGSSDVCLILQLAGDDQVFASSCAAVGDFHRSGLKLAASGSAGDQSDAATAYLLPSDVPVPESAEIARFRASGDANLFSGHSDDLDAVEPFDATRAGGSTFTFVPLATDRSAGAPTS